MARREFHRTEITQTKKLTLSEASRIEQREVEEKQLNHAYKIGKVDGMDAMYTLMVRACDKVAGIGERRKEQLKNTVLQMITDLAKG